MLRFGKIPPRLLQSFGVAGILGEGCKIYYSSLFSTRHIGRVSDLLAAKLQGYGLDELRFRALLLFTFFEAYRGQASAATHERKSLPEALVLECGQDEEKVAVGMSFNFQAGDWPDIAAMTSRIEQGKPMTALERMLVDMAGQADRLIVRYQSEVRRFEIVSLMGIPGAIDEESLLDRQPTQFVNLGKEPEEAPGTDSYTELGDLDYPRLLEDDKPGNKEKAISIGDILARSVREAEHRVEVAGLKEGDESLTRLKGDEATSNRSLHIIRGESSESLRVRDRMTESIHDAARLSNQREREKQEFETEVNAYKGKIAVLEDEVRQLKAEKTLAAQTPRIRATESEPAAYEGSESSEMLPAGRELKASLKEQSRIQAATSSTIPSQEVSAKAIEPESSGGGGWLKKVWPFGSSTRSVPEADPEILTESEGSTQLASELRSAQSEPIAGSIRATESVDSPSTSGVSGFKQSEDAARTDTLVEEIQSGNLEQVITKAKNESTVIQDKIPDGKTRRWVDMLITELVREKGVLNDKAKTLQTSYKAREMEFRRAEMTMQEELRRRDDALKQKTHALSKLKDQFSQMSLQLDKLKNAAGGEGDGHLKHKHDLSKKMLNLAREENQKLTEKIEDLRSQLASAQLASTKRSSASSEIASLVAQNERMQKQIEEYKKTNQQIMERFNQTKREKTANNANTDDMRKKLELGIKQAAASKREAEKLQLKVDEMERDAERLRIELSRAQAEIKKLKQEGGGGGKKGPASAA